MRTTTRTRRAALVLAAGALLATGATACEETPPPVFTVAPGAAGPDRDPGDGTCETAASVCSLEAAVEEANALDTRTTVVVTDDIATAAELEVTGVIDLETGTSGNVDLRETRFVVAEGAQLEAQDVDLHSVEVHGAFGGRRITLGFFDPEGDLPTALVEVGPTGRAMVTNAYLVGLPAPAADNAGSLVLFSSTVRLGDAFVPATVGLTTRTGGETRLIANAFIGDGDTVDTCAGVAPISYGYNLAPDTSCGLTVQGDAQDFVESQTSVDPGSRRLDAIPVGTHQCGTGLTDDLTGDGQRPVDGDGDGTPACDVGALEANEPR